MSSSTTKTSTAGIAKLPLHFDATLAFGDFPGPKFIGKINPGFTAFLIIVQVITPFDGGATVTIGETSAQGNLSDTTQVFLNLAGTYSVDNNHKYTANTDINMYMTGTPTVGSAKVSIFYQ